MGESFRNHLDSVWKKGLDKMIQQGCCFALIEYVNMNKLKEHAVDMLNLFFSAHESDSKSVKLSSDFYAVFQSSDASDAVSTSTTSISTSDSPVISKFQGPEFKTTNLVGSSSSSTNPSTIPISDSRSTTKKKKDQSLWSLLYLRSQVLVSDTFIQNILDDDLFPLINCIDKDLSDRLHDDDQESLIHQYSHVIMSLILSLCYQQILTHPRFATEYKRECEKTFIISKKLPPQSIIKLYPFQFSLSSSTTFPDISYAGVLEQNEIRSLFIENFFEYRKSLQRITKPMLSVWKYQSSTVKKYYVTYTQYKEAYHHYQRFLLYVDMILAPLLTYIRSAVSKSYCAPHTRPDGKMDLSYENPLYTTQIHDKVVLWAQQIELECKFYSPAFEFQYDHAMKSKSKRRYEKNWLYDLKSLLYPDLHSEMNMFGFDWSLSNGRLILCILDLAIDAFLHCHPWNSLICPTDYSSVD
jgi:hypothetical protein